MHRIGLVLGGGGITGAAFELGTLMALEMATGWHPNDADIIVGTSAGASVAAAVRTDRLDVEALVRTHESSSDVAQRIRSRIFQRAGAPDLRRWIRSGLVPGLRNPGLTLAFGSPAPFDASAIGDWMRDQLGPPAERWPARRTAIVAYDVEAQQRVAFGTIGAPGVTLADAVAASSAIPVLFNPHLIGDRSYVDGGVASGTHADLVLGSPEPLDLVIVVPPLAEEQRRRGGMFYEPLFDRVGRLALEAELDQVTSVWPGADVLVLRPPAASLEVMRPNPMDPRAAVPTFAATLDAMKGVLAEPGVWDTLRDHLMLQPR